MALADGGVSMACMEHGTSQWRLYLCCVGWSFVLSLSQALVRAEMGCHTGSKFDCILGIFVFHC